MRRIRGKGTAPELNVRRLTRSMGYRYRLHVKTLPGTPDLAFPSRKAVIFVHGCFWHSHTACRKGRVPSSNTDFWAPKLARNVARDAEQLQSLRKQGWRVLVLWECELKADTQLAQRLRRFLDHKH